MQIPSGQDSVGLRPLLNWAPLGFKSLTERLGLRSCFARVTRYSKRLHLCAAQVEGSAEGTITALVAPETLPKTLERDKQ